MVDAGAGGRRVGMGQEDEDMDDGMKCSFHPHRSNQGGICALCLQEKLGKLVSSSSPLPIRASTSSSSSSSFRSDAGGGGAYYSAVASSSTQFVPENGRPRIPFLMAGKKKSEVGFRRSKSTSAPARGKLAEDYIPKNKSWIRSFLYPSSSKKSVQSSRESSRIASLPPATVAEKPKVKFPESSSAKDDYGDSPMSSQAAASVSRSRSVGCGSRSFSGDFFERISTGFGDCTLRRVESQREGKPKISTAGHRDGQFQRVKCGGIFSGFMIHTSSSSSSASSTHWVSSGEDTTGKFPPAAVSGRSKHKGPATASPMRALGKTVSMEGNSVSNRETTEKNSSSANLDAVPSLLAVRI